MRHRAGKRPQTSAIAALMNGFLEEYEARRAVAGIFKVDYLLVSKPE
jgi:hypothetical protein